MAWLVDLVLPRRCVACGTSADLLCASCFASLRPLRGGCARCGAPTAWPVERCSECAGRRLAFDSARAAVSYAGPSRALVIAWKEHGLRRASVLAANVVASRLEPPLVDVVTAVPADAERLLRRGHHPADRLAHELASRWGLPFARLLIRERPSLRQAGLGLDDRRRNVRRAFGLRGPVPRAVLLVDDVYTTGATVSAAAAVLRRGGAASVEVVTFARTVRTGHPAGVPTARRLR